MMSRHGVEVSRLNKDRVGPKRPTNVTLDAALVDDARALGVNVSQACENGLRQQLRAARERQWRDENREAIAASNAYVEASGVPLAQYRQF